MSALPPLRLVVLISGRGSNLEALVHAIEAGSLNAEIIAVISNRADAQGLQFAQTRHIPTEVLPHHNFDSREVFDDALAKLICTYNPDLILLAGFMRVLTPGFVQQFFPRLINIHPSLLPAFTGLHTHARAIQEGLKLHGCTVHAVTTELDHGPILAQGVVPVLTGDTPDSLAKRVLQIEHLLFPAVIQAIAEQRWMSNTQGWTYHGAPQLEPLHPIGFWHIG